MVNVGEPKKIAVNNREADKLIQVVTMSHHATFLTRFLKKFLQNLF